MKINHGTFDIDRLTPQEIQKISYTNWLNDGHGIDGDDDILHHWEATNSSGIIVDLGGYKGDWSAKMLEKYSGIKELLIYEPVPEFYKFLKERFEQYIKVTVYPEIASNAFGTQNLYIQEAGSSTHVIKTSPMKKTQAIKYNVVDIGAHLKMHFHQWDLMKTPKIDLMKLNIEGDEYRVIESLKRNDNLPHIESLLIQCHPYGKKPFTDYEKMFNTLNETHVREWNYPFIWEFWRLK